MNVRLTSAALDDLEAILLHTAESSGWDRSMDTEAKLWQSFGKLASNPGIGHLRRDILPADLHFYHAAPYMIVYRRDTTPIHILAIVHGSRDLAAILAERFQ